MAPTGISPRRTTRTKKIVVLLIALAAVGCLILYAGDPATSPIFPPCPFHLLTGFWCPGCGSARALHALLNGNIVEALGLNPLVVVAIPFLIYAGISWMLVSLGGKERSRLFSHPFWGWFIVLILFAFWIARNIPVYPFSVLAP